MELHKDLRVRGELLYRNLFKIGEIIKNSATGGVRIEREQKYKRFTVVGSGANSRTSAGEPNDTNGVEVGSAAEMDLGRAANVKGVKQDGHR